MKDMWEIWVIATAAWNDSTEEKLGRHSHI